MRNLMIIFVLIVCLAGTGCATYGAYNQAAKAGTQAIADEALQVKLWSLCNASTYGAIKRWVGSNEALGEALKEICGQVKQADIETSPEP